jgi:ubiquinone/menaquinone biosynthesis C-methylase UbiE
VFDPEIKAHYDLGVEQPRLSTYSLELVRSQELLERYLPAPPCSVLDVGGGPGVYAAWLAGLGDRVHLVDPVPRHVSEALAHGTFTASLGDARELQAGDASYDAVLLMGPLYHLVERADRVRALSEARRVAVPGGPVLAVGISRFASLLDGLRSGWLSDARFRAMVEQDLATGQHRNPAPDERPEWFTTAYLHHPFELRSELEDAGLEVEAVLAVEGPGWLLTTSDATALREAARAVEHEPSLLGATAHLLAVGRAPQ